MKDYSKIRKELQAIGEVPPWFTTGGYQLFDQKYAYKGETVRSRFRSIAKAMAKHAPNVYPEIWSECEYTYGKTYEEAFFQVMWDGFISCSTPLLANGGLRKRGTTVSCAGSYMGNNLFDRYNVITEAAILTKHSHGTSVCIDDWPHEGAPLKRGGFSNGILPVIRDLVTTMDEVVQGSRRGSLAYSLRPQHRDFEAVLLNLYNNPESNNVGWLIDDEFSKGVLHGDPIVCSKLGKILQRKMPRGKGYLTFINKMNRQRAQAFKNLEITTKASNLCVAPEVQILTDKGYFPISDLEGQSVNVWNGKEWSEVEVVKTGTNQKLVTVSTSSGQTIDCTEYHKFYVAENYSGKTRMKRAFELKEGDKLIKFELPVIQGEDDLDMAYTNGFFTGDGFVANKTGNSFIDLYGEKQKLVNEIDGVVSWTTYEPSDRMRAYVKGLKDKFFVPGANYTVESRLNWLAGFVDADGTIARNGTNESLQMTSIEYEFMREVQLMLQTLGVTSKIQTIPAHVGSLPANNGTGEYKDYDCKEAYRLLVSSSGLYKLATLGFTTKRLNWVKRLPQREAEQFSVVVSVADNGRKDDTFCFEEPKRNMGMFNGLLTGQCQETNLIANEKYTFSCVILNYNLELYRTWPKSLLWIGQIMSDCNISEYLETIDEMTVQDQQAMQKIRLFTEHFRSLGSGVLGFHTLLQKERFIVGSLDSLWLNDEIFSRLDVESQQVTQWLGATMGVPEGCKGLGVRNATRLMMPPTKSTAEIMAGASEGIGLDMAMAFTKQSAGGEFFRINKVLVEIMKERGVFSDEEIRKIAESKGTVQNVEWLTEHEKAVFRTAFEIPMEAHLELCSQRQQYIDQAQSINLYFTGSDSEEYISKIHRMAFADENILSLYYIYSMRNSGHITRMEGCEACQ